jgi:hypothetical protein
MTLIESTIETFATRLAKVGETMDLVIAAKGENVRPAVEALAEQLIAFLDATTPDPDLEEEPEGDGYADDEPSLGASEGANQERTWAFRENHGEDREQQNEDGDELDTHEASDLDIYGESDVTDGHAMGSRTVDDEPSLGSLDSRMSQLCWGVADRESDLPWCSYDLEYDPADPPKSQGLDEDERYDEQPCWHNNWNGSNVMHREEIGLTGPSIGNANDAFGVVD